MYNEKQQNFLERKAKLLQMGGEDKIAKQHAKGKLTARERLDLLFDEGTFVEIGLFAHHHKTDFGMDKKIVPCDGVVAGYGKVNGRTVYAYSQDFTALGASIGEMTGKKMTLVQEAAIRTGCPIVTLQDGSGGRIQEGNDIPHLNYVYRNSVKASGYIPQIAAIMGSCAGGCAYSPALMDYLICVDNTSTMFLTGPKVIREVTGEICGDDFGSGRFHNEVSGVSHGLAVDDYDCIEKIKLYLSYLPQNASEKPPVYACEDPIDQPIPELNSVVPEQTRKSYDVHRVLELVADRDSLFEYQPEWAKNAVTTFARLNGKSVGFIANNTKFLGGVCDINSSDKMSRFVNICDAFNIPIVFFADAPGFLPGIQQEAGGVIRHGAKTLFANCSATVPKVRLTMRKLYGGSTSAMCDEGMGTDCTISWPNAEEAVMGAAGACAIIYAKELKKAREEGGEEGYEAKLKELSDEYERIFNNPYRRAGFLTTQMIIMPEETRSVLIKVLEAYENKKESFPPKKHGIFPV